MRQADRTGVQLRSSSGMWLISQGMTSVKDRLSLSTLAQHHLKAQVNDMLRSAVGMTHVLEKGLWWVMRTVNIHWFWLKHQTASRCLTFPTLPEVTWSCGHVLANRRCCYINKLTHVASIQFLPAGQYGLCFGYCFPGPLPLRSHKGQVTLLEPFPGVPSHLDYTQNPS